MTSKEHEARCMALRGGVTESERALIDELARYEAAEPAGNHDLEIWLDDFLHKHGDHKSSGQLAYEIAEHVALATPSPASPAGALMDAMRHLPDWTGWDSMSDADQQLAVDCRARCRAALAKPVSAKPPDALRDRVLAQYDRVTDGDVGAQQVSGQWYVPKWGCDQLDHILDALAQPPSDALAAHPDAAPPAGDDMREALRRLTVKMNKVTARWRHSLTTRKEDMDDLCNSQLAAEAVLDMPASPAPAPRTPAEPADCLCASWVGKANPACPVHGAPANPEPLREAWNDAIREFDEQADTPWRGYEVATRLSQLLSAALASDAKGESHE